MKYSELVQVYEELLTTTKTLEKKEIITNFLKKTKKEDVNNAILLLQGRVFPPHEKKEIGVAKKLIIKLLHQTYGIKEETLKQWWRETGDLGTVAQKAVEKKQQQTLTQQPLTIQQVILTLQKTADITGKNAVNNKLNQIKTLLKNATPIEAKYVVRTILGTLRVGAGFGIIRDAISQAYNVDKEKLQKAYDLTNDLSKTAEIAATQGNEGLENFGIQIFKPVRAMLYQRVRNIKEGFKQVGKPCAIEEKYDGLRVQIHYDGEQVKLFTRRLEDVTKQFPEVVENAKKNLNCENCIIDSEGVGYDPRTGKLIPFQQLSKRIKRKYNIKETAQKMPVRIYAFDLLMVNNESQLRKPFKERRKKLEQIIKPNNEFQLAKQIITSNEEEAEQFFKKSIEEGEEGVMMKNLEAEYKPGSRVGYGVKVKTMLEPLDLAITGAVWGEGKRSKWLSSFYVACKKGNQHLEVGKVATGLTEEQFKEITKRLKPLIIEQRGKEVRTKPEVIVEIGYEEVQKSPTYSSGYALRFPRLLRFRDDKESADSYERVKKIYESQQ